MTIAYIVLGILLLWLVGNLFTYPLQHYFVMWPKKLDKDHNFHFFIPFTEHTIQTQNNGNLNVLHFNNLGEKRKGVIIYYHGNANNLTRWGHAGEFFQRYGYEVIIYDFRSYGKSTGKMTETNFYTDAMAIYQFALDRYKESEIVVYGRSFGAALSSFVASKFHPTQLILETPFSSVKDLFYTYYPFFPPIFIFKYILPTKKFLKEVKCRVTIFHGTTDLIVPLRCAKKNIKSLKPDDRFIIANGAAHGDVSRHEEYQRVMKELL